MDKFINFLDRLDSPKTRSVLEAVFDGYIACFEAVDLPEFKVRPITEQEIRKLMERRPEIAKEYPGNPVPFLMTLSVVYSPDIPGITKIARNVDEANNLVKELKQQFSGVMFKGEKVNEPAWPTPSGVIEFPEKVANLPPEIRNVEDPVGKEQTLHYAKRWSDYLKRQKDKARRIGYVNS